MYTCHWRIGQKFNDAVSTCQNHGCLLLATWPPLSWTQLTGKEKTVCCKGYSVFPATGQTNEVTSPMEPDNSIILTPSFSSIIFYYFSHLTWLQVPPDSGLKVITAAPKQQTFHVSRYLYIPTRSACHTWC